MPTVISVFPKDFDNNQIIIDLENSGYSGPGFPISLAGVPELRYDSDGGDDVYSAPVRRLSLELTLVTDNVSNLEQILNENLTCSLYYGATGFHFYGYFFGDGYEYSETDLNVAVKVRFVDFIGKLKNIKFRDAFDGVTPWHVDAANGGNSRYGFRYHVTRDIFGAILRNTNIYDIYVIGSGKVYNSDGVALTTYIDANNSTDRAMLAGAYIDVARLWDKTLYEIIEMLCLSFGYYVTMTYKSMVFVHIPSLCRLGNIPYIRLIYDGNSKTAKFGSSGTTSVTPHNIDKLSEAYINTVGVRNVRIKSDYGLAIDTHKTFNEFGRYYENNLNISSAVNTGFFRTGSQKNIIYYEVNGTFGLRPDWKISYTTGDWMHNYAEIPLRIRSVGGSNFAYMEMTITLDIDDMDRARYVSLILGNNATFNENGPNYCIKNNEAYFISYSGDVFESAKQSVAVNEKTLTKTFRFWLPTNDWGISILVGMAYYNEGAFAYYCKTCITSVKVSITNLGTEFPSGETINVINSSAIKSYIEKSLEFGSVPTRVMNVALPETQLLYEGSVYYGSSLYQTQGYLFGEDGDAYKLNEYVGRSIAKQYSLIRKNADIGAVYNITEACDSAGLMRHFNSILSMASNDRFYLPVSGTFRLIDNVAKMRAVEVVLSVSKMVTEDNAYTIITEDNGVLITET